MEGVQNRIAPQQRDSVSLFLTWSVKRVSRPISVLIGHLLFDNPKRRLDAGWHRDLVTVSFVFSFILKTSSRRFFFRFIIFVLFFIATAGRTDRHGLKRFGRRPGGQRPVRESPGLDSFDFFTVFGLSCQDWKWKEKGRVSVFYVSVVDFKRSIKLWGQVLEGQYMAFSHFFLCCLQFKI